MKIKITWINYALLEFQSSEFEAESFIAAIRDYSQIYSQDLIVKVERVG